MGLVKRRLSGAQGATADLIDRSSSKAQALVGQTHDRTVIAKEALRPGFRGYPGSLFRTEGRPG